VPISLKKVKNMKALTAVEQDIAAKLGRLRGRLGHIYPLKRRIGHIYPLARQGRGCESKAENKVAEDR